MRVRYLGYAGVLIAAGFVGARSSLATRFVAPPKQDSVPMAITEPARMPSPPKAKAQEASRPSAAAGTVSATVPDSIGAVLEHVELPADLRWRVELAAADKQAALARLQEEALQGGLAWQEVSVRAAAIQIEFERRLSETLDFDQMRQYFDLKSRGLVGTYAIVLPGNAYRK